MLHAVAATPQAPCSSRRYGCANRKDSEGRLVVPVLAAGIIDLIFATLFVLAYRANPSS